MRKLVMILMLLSVAALAIAAPVWTDSVPIRQGVNIEWFRTGIETNDGCAIYVWSDTKLGERDLWAQKVDAQGNMVWGDPVLVDGKPDRQEDPVITRTSDNNYIIAWIDFYDDLDGNVYAQKLNANGQLMWQTGGKPVCTIPGIQLSLNIESDNAGGAYIVWMDSRNPSKDLFAQRIDSSGNPVWTPNGIPFANGIGDEIQNTMLPDGQGGVMFAYTYTYGNNEDIYAKRFLPNGNMAWNEPIALAVGPESQSKVRMASIGNGEFILTWEHNTGEDPDIAAQKININGQVGWTSPLIVYGDSGTPEFAPQENPRIVGTSDNAAIVVWEDRRNDPQEPDLYAQKISSAGVLQWNVNGVPLAVAPFNQFGPRMAADNAGGCYVVWDDRRNGNTPNEDIYAQHLSSTGAALWEPNGKAICMATNTQEGGLIKVAGNNVFINWMDLRNGSVGLYYQALTSSGTPLLETDGKLIFWGLSGDAPLKNYHILPRANDAVIVWMDTRYANLGYHIYFQFLNPDGSVALEPNGRSVTTQTGAHQLNPAAAVTPDGHILVLWEDKRHEYPKIYMQLLSPTGERLWGDTGTPLTNASPVDQKDPFVEYDPASASFIIGWSNYDQFGSSSSFYYHVWGQRIHNGQKMWGPDGLIISDLPASELNSECVLYSMHDRYYVWQSYNPMEGVQLVFAKHVDLDGDSMPNWPDAGLRISTHSDWDTSQTKPVSALTDQGLFVMWMDGREDWVPNYYAQHLSTTGERMWNPLGVNLADHGREQEMATPLKGGRTDLITVSWCENIGGMHDIMGQRLTLAGDPLWGELGYFIVQKDSTQSNPCFVAFPNNGMAIAWTEFLSLESDIYYKYINGDGSFVGNPGGNVLCEAGKSQYNPDIAVVGNQAFVVWADGRSSGKTEILGLYAQKINNETVANDDPAIPPTHGFRLDQNHPNPFNPSTSISFSITDPSKHYSLDIFNIKGQKVKTLHKGSFASGTHRMVWDGKDAKGSEVSSGVYFYRLSDGKETQSRKMLLMK